MSVPLQASIRASPYLNFFRHMLLLKLLSIDWSVAGAKNPAATFIVRKGLSHLHHAGGASTTFQFSSAAFGQQPCPLWLARIPDGLSPQAEVE